jgi:hypothetical protein
VTWVYLSRVGGWEARLQPGLRSLVVPNVSDPNRDYGQTIRTGPYAAFPHFSTSELQYTVEATNLLAHQTGWVVLNNADTFRQALGAGRRP